MNEARSLVGFDKLTTENRFKITEEDWAGYGQDNALELYLAAVCDSIRTYEKDSGPDGLINGNEGTFAYAIQEGKTADCQAAVDLWTAAFPNFNGLLPPVYTLGTAPYDRTQNISFLSLFNPYPNPKVDCAYFTCGATQNAKGSEKEVKTLICVTIPHPLTENELPYTQEQWDKITTAFKPSSAVAATPATLLLAAAVLAAVVF
ncbi:SAG family member [Eimeria mitis]|uniref:SAG family member n=1 Tax=Eimeria mitis TaxID=44415 RepID=U6KBT9_9EIME|nr:SAG family member [Eimeria mitis]CDJ32933.1 SAG family member [Eimeria mitis]